MNTTIIIAGLAAVIAVTLIMIVARMLAELTSCRKLLEDIRDRSGGATVGGITPQPRRG